MIPYEAVEAVARKLCALAGWDWDRLDAPADVIKDFRGQLFSQARAVLEAAAPDLMAEAWDEAIEAYKAWTWDDEDMDPLTNPYRKPPNAN